MLKVYIVIRYTNLEIVILAAFSTRERAVERINEYLNDKYGSYLFNKTGWGITELGIDIE